MEERAQTRIVCTIGPASAGPVVLSRMIRSGMDVARLNFSHGTHEDHAELFAAIHLAAKKANKHVAVLQDLQGPKIRVGNLPEEGIRIPTGTTVTLTCHDEVYQEKLRHVPVTYRGLWRDVAKGHRIFLDDGMMALSVLRVNGRRIHCLVDEGGTLFSHKGINLPDTKVRIPLLQKKDLQDLEYGISLGVDWVCISFVEDARDIEEVRSRVLAYARRSGVRPPKIMAKVERAAAVAHLEDIVATADGVMIGRGDLGIEVPFSEVPRIQKDIAELCRKKGKPCIVATHMLESMRMHPRATRAEISDIATAVYDHVDAVMLSAESATGAYPDVAVQTMAQAIASAEQSLYAELHPQALPTAQGSEVIALSLALLAEGGGIDAILLPGNIPYIGEFLRYRPKVPCYVVVPDAASARQAVLLWGANPLILDMSPATLAQRALREIRRSHKKMSCAVVMCDARGSWSFSLESR